MLTPSVVWQKVFGTMLLACLKCILEQHASTPHMGGWSEAWGLSVPRSFLCVSMLGECVSLCICVHDSGNTY